MLTPVGRAASYQHRPAAHLAQRGRSFADFLGRDRSQLPSTGWKPLLWRPALLYHKHR